MRTEYIIDCQAIGIEHAQQGDPPPARHWLELGAQPYHAAMIEAAYWEHRERMLAPLRAAARLGWWGRR